jgi:hypothetical protein
MKLLADCQLITVVLSIRLFSPLLNGERIWELLIASTNAVAVFDSFQYCARPPLFLSSDNRSLPEVGDVTNDNYSLFYEFIGTRANESSSSRV